MVTNEMISVFDQIKHQLDPTFLCKKCGEVTINAFQSSCGCFRCCGSCAVGCVCVVCQKEISFLPDKAISKKLRNIKLTCPFSECKLQLEYEGFLSHMNHCKYRVVECVDCHEMIALHNIQGHKSIECNQLAKECLKCNKIVKFSKTKHFAFDERTPPDCNELFGNCINCNVKNVALKEHYDKCERIPCLLKSYGCDGFIISVKCSRVNSHVNIFDKVIKKFNDRTEEIMDKLSVDVNKNGIIEEINYLEKEITNIQKIISKNLKLNETLKKRKFIWIISDVDDFFNNQNAVLSDPMYSDDYGYKLCLKIYPKGDGIGKNEYMSVYYVVMKGAYDDLLPWPFNKKVKITLYNQIDILKSKSELYKPDPKSDSTFKPKFTMNVATGNPTYVRIDELKRKGFIVDSKMFIEITVENQKTLL